MCHVHGWVQHFGFSYLLHRLVYYRILQASGPTLRTRAIHCLWGSTPGVLVGELGQTLPIFELHFHQEERLDTVVGYLHTFPPSIYRFDTISGHQICTIHFV